MTNKAFIDAVNERLNKRVKKKLEKDGVIFADDIYDIFMEYEYNDILKNHAISQVSPLVFHDQIADDPDFRRAANTVKGRYSHVG